MAAPWTLPDGLACIRAIQEAAKSYGYHITLGGGVLNTGASEKDLDLFFLPMGRTFEKKQDDLIQWLTGLWGTPRPLGNYDVSPRIPLEQLWADDPHEPPSRPFIDAQRIIRDAQLRVMGREDGLPFINWHEHQDDYFGRGDGVVVNAPVSSSVDHGQGYKVGLKFMRGSDRIDVFIL